MDKKKLYIASDVMYSGIRLSDHATLHVISGRTVNGVAVFRVLK